LAVGLRPDLAVAVEIVGIKEGEKEGNGRGEERGKTKGEEEKGREAAHP